MFVAIGVCSWWCCLLGFDVWLFLVIGWLLFVWLLVVMLVVFCVFCVNLAWLFVCYGCFVCCWFVVLDCGLFVWVLCLLDLIVQCWDLVVDVVAWGDMRFEIFVFFVFVFLFNFFLFFFVFCFIIFCFILIRYGTGQHFLIFQKNLLLSKPIMFIRLLKHYIAQIHKQKQD